MSNEKHTPKRHDPPINEEWLTIRDTIQRHSGTALTILLVIAIAAIAVWSQVQRRARGRQEAQHLLASAQSISQFEEIVTRFPKSEAAPLAVLAMAKLQFDLGRYTDAITQYETFLESWQEHPMAATAVLGRLFSLEALGTADQIQEAEAGFRAFADRNPGHYLYPQARLGEGRCKQQLGRLEEARALYKSFLENNPENPWQIQIEERLLDLERKISRQQS